jgi:hypothetical protein
VASGSTIHLEDDMNRRAVAASWAMAVFMAAGTALAAPSNVSGKILRVDVANDTVTLADGQYYIVPPTIKLDGFKTGDQITMSVDKDQYGIYHVKTITEADHKSG